MEHKIPMNLKPVTYERLAAAALFPPNINTLFINTLNIMNTYQRSISPATMPTGFLKDKLGSRKRRQKNSPIILLSNETRLARFFSLPSTSVKPYRPVRGNI